MGGVALFPANIIRDPAPGLIFHATFWHTLPIPRRVTSTCRCSERRFFMRPDKETSNAFIYCLAVSAASFGIGVVGFGTMSNHYHAIVVDREGCFPDFLYESACCLP